jgi:hypothetical protein
MGLFNAVHPSAVLGCQHSMWMVGKVMWKLHIDIHIDISDVRLSECMVCLVACLASIPWRVSSLQLTSAVVGRARHLRHG